MIDPDTLNQLKEIFALELQELHQLLMDSLKKLKENPSDEEAIEDAYRAAHTIKGAAKGLSFTEIGDIAEELEAEFAQWRHREKQITPDGIDVCVDKSNNMMAIFKSG